LTKTIAPRVRTLVLLLLAAVCALLAGAGPASAHAALTGSDPRQGAVVDKAPARVTLTFSETVSLDDDSLRVLDPRGARVDDGRPADTGGTTYTLKLRPGLPDGTYTVAYQVVSADSHPVSGAYTFSVGAPSETSAVVDVQEAGGGLVGALYGFGRYVSYAGFVVLAGGSAFVLACWPRGSGVRPLQRLVVSGWLALTSATLLLLLLRGSYTGSGKLADVFDLGLLGQVLQTKTGASLVSRLLLLAAAALFVAVLFGAHDRDEDEEKRDLAFGLAAGGAVVATGLAATWALAEHASVGLQAGLAMPVDVVHLLAVAGWLGGLAALLVALYRAPAGTPVPARAVDRFSRLAFGSVVALVVTGVYQSWRQLGSWSAFTDTRYGQLLLAKIALVAVMVGVAFLSRRWTARLAARPVQDTAPQREEQRTDDREKETAGVSPAASGASAPAGETGDSRRAAQLARQRAAMDTARQKRLRDADPHRLGLRRSVLAEAGVAVVLLAVTTVLTQTEPGRTEQEARTAGRSAAASSTASGPLALDMPFDTGSANGTVRIELDPARVGDNDLHLYVEDPDGRAFDIPEIKVAFTLEAKDLGPLPVTPEHLSTGHWSASGVQLPMAGDWKIAVTVRTSDIDQVTLSKNAQIG
jgi:copper transport protein